MTETVDASGPVAFAASFPPEERFSATAAEIAGRLAAVSGCSAGAAEEIRDAVDRAFRAALALVRDAAEPRIELSLRTTGAAFDADVACGGSALCHCSRPRTA